MGIRIAFYETTDGKSLCENFTRTFSEFKHWLLVENKESIDEFNERIISEEIESYLKHNGEVIELEKVPKRILDVLIYQYLLAFCDHGIGKININLIGPLIKRHRYNNSFRIISHLEIKVI